MKPKAWLTLLLVSAFASMSITSAEIAPTTSQRHAEEMGLIVSALRSADTRSVRAAIINLRKESDSPSVSSAVQPLIEIIDDETIDGYTRAQATHALGLIGTIHGGTEGLLAISKVEEQLTESPNEIVRSSAAYILGRSHLVSVQQSLVKAESNDPSPLVRITARKVLPINSEGPCTSANCNTNLAATSVAPMTGSQYPAVDFYLWAKGHVLVSIDSIGSSESK